MQNCPESAGAVCVIFKVQLKAFSVTSPYSQPEAFVLISSVFS